MPAIRKLAQSRVIKNEKRNAKRLQDFHAKAKDGGAFSFLSPKKLRSKEKVSTALQPPAQAWKRHRLFSPGGKNKDATMDKPYYIRIEEEGLGEGTDDTTVSLTPSPAASTTQFFPSEYPLLQSLGIQTDLSIEANKIKFDGILREIHKLTKEDPNAANFQLENSTGMMITFVSQFSSQKSFSADDTKHKKLKTIIEFISSKTQDDTDEPEGAQFILHKFAALYLNTLKKFTIPAMILRRLTAIETAAILKDASISQTSWKTIVRHLRYHYGAYISATRASMQELTARKPIPTFRKYPYIFDVTKEPEKVEYCAFNLEDLILLQIERELESKLRLNTAILPKYGYATRENNDGIRVLLGSDHGAGASTCLCRLLLEPSSERRKEESADYGTVTYVFAHMQCKKDNAELLNLVAPTANDGIELMRKSKLVAVKDKNNLVQCKFIPKGATRISARASRLCYTHDDEDFQIELDGFDPESLLVPWIAIQNFVIKVPSDLLCQFILQGREGHSTSKCLRCIKTSTEWKQNAIVGRPLQMDDLHGGDLRFGCKMDPLWNIWPGDYIVPLLHIEMGLANDVYKKVNMFCMTEIDAGSAEEVDDRLEHSRLQSHQNKLSEDLEARNISTKLRSKELTKIRAALVKESKKKNQPAEVIARIESDMTSIEEWRIVKRNELSNLKKTIQSNRVLLLELKMQIDAFVKGRRKGKDGLDSKIEQILQKYNVTVQAFHGGSLNGIAVRRFLERIEDIMEEIEAACIIRWTERQDDDIGFRPCTLAYLKAQLLLYKETLQALDALFGHARMIDPTEEEKQFTKVAVIVLEAQWNKLQLSKTPKWHLGIVHIVEQQEEGDGLGDRIEEFIEKFHQELQRQHVLVARMAGGYTSQTETMMHNIWRDSHPDVLRKVEEVRKGTARGTYDTAGRNKPMERRQIRRDNILRLKAKLDAS